jgi:dTMP kinase
LGILIALEGIDGSGKGTQAARLCSRITHARKRAVLLSFPRYEATHFGSAIGDYLNGRFGTLDQVSPYLASVLYAGDRFESRDLLHDSLNENDIVLLDRYIASNSAHQAAKLSGTDRGELIEWIRTLEHQVFQLPYPDMVLLLDLPAHEARKLIAKKRARSYTNLDADLHEADVDYLERVRNVYLELASTVDRWETIECYLAGKVRSVDEINDEIWNVLQAKGYL